MPGGRPHELLLTVKVGGLTAVKKRLFWRIEALVAKMVILLDRTRGTNGLPGRASISRADAGFSHVCLRLPNLGQGCGV
jgi:hypothetical protein